MKNIILWSLLLFSFCHADIPTISLAHEKIDIESFDMQYFVDPTNTLSLFDLQKRHFIAIKSKASMGYHKNKTVWFRFNLENPISVDKEVYIYHKEAYKAHTLIFYRLQNDTLLESVDFSKTEEIYKREIKDSSPTYRVILKPHTTTTIYIKNISRNSYLVNIKLLDKDAHAQSYLLRNSAYVFLFGILFALVLYNIILFLSIKQSEYFYYIIFIIASISYLLYISGLPLEFLSLNESQYSNLLFGVSLLQMALIMFTKKVLDTKIFLPKVNSYLSYLFLLPFGIFVVGFIIGIDKILSVQALLALIVAVSLLIVGLIAQKHKIPTANYYLLPIGFYLFFSLIGIFTYLGVLPYNGLTRNAFFFASLTEVFLLSFLLSKRIRLLRVNMIKSEEKLKHEIHSRNEVLQSRVKEKTQELQKLNTVLETKISSALVEIKQKDEDLLRQSRMAMMGEMLSMITHQWRQPLTTIVCIKSTMEMQIEMDQFDKETMLKQLKDIDTYSQYMSKTVDDFSGFFKPNKQKQSFMLDQLVETSLLMMKDSFTQAHIEVISDFTLSRQLLSLDNELLQVFLNILKNTYDVIQELEIENPSMTITIKEFDDRQELSFHDNAGGIPEAIIDKVFDPYFSSKEEKKGTGLGLYMSRTIVEEHCQGKLSVVNDNGGAKFTVILYFD